jgi:NAD(P)-dependent dehydrogenase (short-subunit alcohol dehydrogenase family)
MTDIATASSTSGTLTRRVALVTGGSRNIGRETAVALARAGMDVVVTYRVQRDAAEQTLKELAALGVRGHAVQADLTGTADLDRLVGELRATLADWGHDRLDVLVNNAGTVRFRTFDAVTEADLDAVYDTNYKSVFFLTQRLADLLADGGRIVNLGSGTAKVAFGPLVSYGPFKAALQSLTTYLAAYLGPRGITVNAVAPGGLDDDFNAPLFGVMPGARGYIATNTALGKVGTPADVGSVIAFLCSPDAGFISGAVLPVDGGYHL